MARLDALLPPNPWLRPGPAAPGALPCSSWAGATQMLQSFNGSYRVPVKGVVGLLQRELLYIYIYTHIHVSMDINVNMVFFACLHEDSYQEPTSIHVHIYIYIYIYISLSLSLYMKPRDSLVRT